MWKWLRGRRRLLPLVLPALLVAAGVASAWFLTRDPSAAAQSTTATVTRETVKQTVSADGTVEAGKTREESFEVAGTVTAVLVKEGEKVTKGEVLATVGQRALIASRRAAAASLAADYTQLDDDQDAGASDVQIAADQTAIVSARATPADAREAVENATLRATIAGTMTSVGISRGDTVSSETSGAGTDASDTSDTSDTSSGTIPIVSTGSYVVDATVAAEDVQQVEKGMQAELTVSGREDTVYGTISDVGLVAQTNDSGAAVLPVTIAVTGKQQDLYAGVSATASIVVKQVPNALTVNSRALSTENGTTYVTKLVDGEEVRTEVETGGVYGMSTVITSGLEEGDEVVVPGFIAPTGGSGGERQQLPDFQVGGMQPPAGGPAQ